MDMMESTLRMMEEGERSIVLSKNRNVIALLGLTGTGKTTLGLLLTDDNTRLTAVPDGEINYIIVDEKEKISSTTDAFTSKTAIPEMMIDNTTGTVFYDMPGFEDTRNSSTEIATMFYIKKVLSHAERVKLVFAVNYNTVVNPQSRNAFPKLLEYATILIKDVTKFEDGIGMILTRVVLSARRRNGIWVVPSVNAIVQDAGKKLRATVDEIESLTESEKKLVRVLSTQLGDDYTRLSIFSNVDEAGPLSNNTRVQEEKGRIKRMIDNNLAYTVSNGDDFGYPLSEAAKGDISRMFQNITDTLTGTLKRSMETIEQRLSDDENRRLDLETLGENYKNIRDRLTDVMSNAQDSIGTKLKRLFQTVQELTGSSQDSTNIEELVENLRRISFVTVGYDLNKTFAPILTYVRETHERVRSTEHWFQFLKNFERRTLGKRLKPASVAYTKYRKTLASIENTKVNITLGNFIGFQDLIKELSLENDPTLGLAEIIAVRVNPARARMLDQVVNSTLTSRPVSTCYDSDKQRISAPYMGLKEAMALARVECPSIRVLEIFAGKKLWIDDDVKESGENFTLVVAAPVWEVVGKRKIILNGRDGADLPGYPLLSGMDGSPGLPGENGGHFVGIADEIVNLDKLSITVNGGRGGPGQSGGDGRNGSRGRNTLTEGLPGMNLKTVITIGDPRWSKGCCENSEVVIWTKGIDGERGGLGGRGGAGGLGGRAGTIRMTVPNIAISQVAVNDGEVGIKGNPGAGGIDGQPGQDCEFRHVIYAGPGLIRSHHRTTTCYPNVCPDLKPRERDDTELNREKQQYPPAQLPPDFGSLSGNYKNYIRDLRKEWYGLRIPTNFTESSNYYVSGISGDDRGKSPIDFGYFSYSIYLLNTILRKCTKVKELKFRGDPNGDGIHIEPVILTAKFGELLDQLKKDRTVTNACGNFDPISMMTDLRRLMNQKRYVGIRQMLKDRLASLGLTPEIPPEETERIIDQLLER